MQEWRNYNVIYLKESDDFKLITRSLELLELAKPRSATAGFSEGEKHE